VGISNRIESIDVSGTIITPLNAILTRLDGQEQQYEQISKNIQDVAKSTCLKIKNNFSELLHDNYLNCQEQGYVDTDFSASMGAENIKAMQKRLTDTASASFDAGKHMSVLKDAIVAVFDPLTVSIFGYSYSLSSTSHPNSTSSLLPAVPKIPVLLPDGIQSGASINKWLLSFFPKTFLLAFLLFPNVVCEYFRLWRNSSNNVWKQGIV